MYVCMHACSSVSMWGTTSPIPLKTWSEPFFHHPWARSVSVDCAKGRRRWHVQHARLLDFPYGPFCARTRPDRICSCLVQVAAVAQSRRENASQNEVGVPHEEIPRQHNPCVCISSSLLLVVLSTLVLFSASRFSFRTAEPFIRNHVRDSSSFRQVEIIVSLV